MKAIFKKIAQLLAQCLGFKLIRASTTPGYFGYLIRERLRRRGEFCFLQIGANDGKRCDPLYGFVSANPDKVRGVVLEPLPDFYAQLKENYKKFPNIIPLNRAIHNENKKMTLYRADPAKSHKLPDYAKGIASFSKTHHEYTGVPTDCIIEEQVECISLERILKEYQNMNFDLLQIDTEGYDAEILLAMDLTKFKPFLIQFEHNVHKNVMSAETLETVAQKLRSAGYDIVLEPNDAIAYQMSELL